LECKDFQDETDVGATGPANFRRPTLAFDIAADFFDVAMLWIQMSMTERGSVGVLKN